VIAEHWESLARHAYAKISRALGIGRPELDACLAFIQTNLNPYPGRQFYSPWQEDASATGAPAAPDVIIRRELDEYRVELPPPVEGELRLSASYARLRRLIAEAPQRRLPPGWRAALESVRRARWFLSCLQMRDATLKQVCECLVAEQRGYLDTGREESIRPLTQTRVAAAVGKHESTVSRAVAGKFALLPWGALVPLAKFFDSSAAPKGIIKELIEREDRSRPLTDSELSSLLRSRGYDLARRTVTKYRLALDIPSHTRRRLLYARTANGR
jgi:RNA polymerase sigma-54 factor